MRYGFGKNWAEFVDARLSDEVINESRHHLAAMLKTDDLHGRVFVDIGCGSGIHSLAALRMGAERVVSFDYDRDSVNTTQRVRAFAHEPANWEVMHGSVLDSVFMSRLPKADVVYSWGVLHHTGDMWSAVRNAALPLKDDGVFYIALYSSDNYVDPPPSYWLDLKRRYNLASKRGRRWMEWQYMLRFHVLPELKSGRNPFKLIRKYGTRGMTYWTDVKDWLGGWPMDFAGFHETKEFCQKELGLFLVNTLTGEGCTEYVMTNLEKNAYWREITERRAPVALPGPFKRAVGHAYVAELPNLSEFADSAEGPRRSSVMVFEGGELLGLAHSVHDHVVRFGGGRFSHWGPRLLFSTRDNTDPNTNGREYTYCERY